MEHLSSYIFSVSAAAVLCAVIGSVVDQKAATGKLIKILCGIFMAVTVLSPVTDLDILDFSQYMEEFDISADVSKNDGIQMARQEQASVIIQNLQAYILDKASDIGLDVEVEVTLTCSDPPTPERVALRGEAAPYKKQVLINYITENLGITRENLQWT